MATRARSPSMGSLSRLLLRQVCEPRLADMAAGTTELPTCCSTSVWFDVVPAQRHHLEFSVYICSGSCETRSRSSCHRHLFFFSTRRIIPLLVSGTYQTKMPLSLIAYHPLHSQVKPPCSDRLYIPFLAASIESYLFHRQFMETKPFLTCVEPNQIHGSDGPWF